MAIKFAKNLELAVKDGISALLNFFLRQPHREIPSSARRILFFRHDLLGDMILSLPILKAFQRRYPEAVIDVFCSPKNFKILEDSGLADHLYIYQKNALHLVRWVFFLRKMQYDLIINLITHASFTFGLVARLAGPHSVRVAGHQEQFAYLYNHHVRLPAKGSTQMLRVKYLLCEDIIGKMPERLPTPWISYKPPIKAQALEIKNKILSDLGNSEADFLVGLNLSAGMARREWPLEKYQQFLSEMIEKYKDRIGGWVILSNPGDPARALQLKLQVKHNKLVMTDAQNDFRVILELLPVFKLVITPDTAFVHAASAMGVPVLAMKIGQSANVWDPFGVPYKVVTAADYYSLAGLEVNEVAGAFANLLETVMIKG
jgi:ADP-heptose:LPS heptosyltransferase